MLDHCGHCCLRGPVSFPKLRQIRPLAQFRGLDINGPGTGSPPMRALLGHEMPCQPMYPFRWFTRPGERSCASAPHSGSGSNDSSGQHRSPASRRKSGGRMSPKEAPSTRRFLLWYPWSWGDLLDRHVRLQPKHYRRTPMAAQHPTRAFPELRRYHSARATVAFTPPRGALAGAHCGFWQKLTSPPPKG